MSNKMSRKQAAIYVTRLYSGELTAVEEKQLLNWRAADPENEREFNAMLALWDATGELSAENPEQRDASSQPRVTANSKSISRGGKGLAKGLAVAASVAVLAFLLTFLGSLQFYSEPPAVITDTETPETRDVLISSRAMDPFSADMPTANNGLRVTEQQDQDREIDRYFRTAVGEVTHITLTDGSVLSLNTDSEVVVNIDDQERAVRLLRGEVFFDIAKDEQRPFRIDTGRRFIEVLGTQFNVRKRADERTVQIAVVEGKVAVKRATATSERRSFEDPASYLLAGYIGSYSQDDEEPEQVVSQNKEREVDIAQTWRKGVVRFDDQSLSHVVREFNRYREVKIELADERVEGLRISGVFHLNNNDHILAALEKTLPIKIERTLDNVKIMYQ